MALFGLLACLLLALVWGPSVALAQANPDRAFTVSNYPVFATAQDAVTAKRIALKEGQDAALRSVLKRIVPVTAYARLRALPEMAASRFIEGMSVKSERNSSTEYIATMDFTFSAETLRKHLRSVGVPFVDTQAEPAILVPITLQAGGGQGANGVRATPKPDLGSWGDTWKSLDLANSVAPLRVAALRPAIGADVITRLRERDTRAAQDFSAKYGSSQTIAAISQYDRAAGKLHVVLSGRDAVGAVYLKRSYPVLDGDVAYAQDYAAAVSQGILEGRWKAVRSKGSVGGGTGPNEPVSIEVYFGSPAQWYDIEGQLRALPGISDFRTEGVSARSADIAFNYPGGGARLRGVLAQQGFSLTPAGQRWVLQKSF